MNSTPRHPHRPRTSPYAPRQGFPPSHVPSPPSQPYSTPVRHQHYSSPSHNFSTPPPPWSGGLSPMPPPPHGQFFTPSPHPLFPSPLSTSSSAPFASQSTRGEATPGMNYSPSPGSFYAYPDMPSPQTKRKRFAPIRGRDGRGRSGGRHHHNRSFRGRRGGGGRGRSGEGIDAYYDRFMLENPWRDLLPVQGAGEAVGGKTNTQVSVEQDGETSSNTQECSGGLEGKECDVNTTASPSAGQHSDSSPPHSHQEFSVT